MVKINLITKKDLSFGALEFEKNQFEFPKVLRVDFARTLISYEYENKGGENVRTETIKRLRLFGIDDKLANLMESQGYDLAEVNSLEMWLYDNFEKVIDYKQREVIRTIEIQDFAVVPKWENNGYRDVNLVVKKFKELHNE